MCRDPGPVPDVVDQVAEHDEPQTSQDNQGNDGDVHGEVGLVTDQTLAEKGEPGVAEGRDGMEQGIVDRLKDRETASPGDEQRQPPQRLQKDGQFDDSLGESRQIIERELFRRLLEYQAILQGDLSQYDRDERGQGHVSQAAELDQRQQNELTEEGQPGPDVEGRQSGHTDGRCGGEEGVPKGQRMAVLRRPRKGEEPRPQGDEAEKKEVQDLCGRQTGNPLTERQALTTGYGRVFTQGILLRRMSGAATGEFFRNTDQFLERS